jgi:hypothetical protein
VEICNTGSVTENLLHWRLRGGVDFTFTAAHELDPGDILVVVGFDPMIEVGAANTFRTTYGIDASFPLVGPWTDGPLNNSTGMVRLQRPDSPPPGDPTSFPQVTEDEVIYFNTAPWPEDPDGNGDALNRTGIDLFGNFSTSWNAVGPTPGAKRFDYASYRDLTFGPGMPPGSGELEDFDIDGIPNVVEFALGLNPLLFDADQLPPLVVEGGSLTLSYNRHNLLSGITCQVQVSTDLIIWNPVPDVLVSTQNFIEIRRASVPMSPNGSQFMRLAITY